MTFNFTISNWVLDNLIPIGVLGLLFVVLISAIVFTLNNRHLSKNGEKYKDSTVHILLVVITSFFTGLATLIPILQDNLIFLQHLPYVGEFIITVYAAANFLYALRLKVWFVAIQNWLRKEDKQPTTVPTPPSVPSVPNLPEVESDFEVKP